MTGWLSRLLDGELAAWCFAAVPLALLLAAGLFALKVREELRRENELRARRFARRP